LAEYISRSLAHATSHVGEKMGIRLTKSDKAFIQQLPVCHLATATEDCEPIVRPVWSVYDGVYIYFASDPDTPKLDQIDANPQVSVVYDDYDRNNWSTVRGVRIQGEAELLWSGKEYQYAHSLLKEKFPEYRTEEGGWKEGDLPIVKITPTSFARWQEGKWPK
jgi:nitroimidazol reductase NimA-like FMN-containing flavoprotein (pyridoxamine 5'-phosphate oxidase superfamily)